jgi:peptide/nickel transport system substrate-binding protein
MNRSLLNLAILAALVFSLLPGATLAAPVPQAEEGQAYVVQKADWLSKLADKYLGNVNAWSAIMLGTNKKAETDSSFHKIDNPDVIEPGWKIWIPGASEAKELMEASAKPATFIFARGPDSVQLDPSVVTDGESFRVTNQGCESLLAYKADTTEVIPSLAESWESNADGTVWTFYLRKGVKFHDGTPFNAEAVVFNFERWWKTDNPYHFKEQVFEYWGAMWNGFDDDSIVSKIEAVDDYTVKFTLKEPLAPILANMAMSMFNIASPEAIKTYGTKYGTPEVGYVCTGPYKFVEWVSSDHITLKRNPDYWGKIPGNVEEIVFRVIPDNSARFLALKAGDIQMMEEANVEDLKAAEADPSLRILTRPALNTAYVAFSYHVKELQDLKVRQAIAMAIDKKAIVDAFYGGYGQVAENFLPPIIWGHNYDVKGYPYDPEKAKQLLKEAGFPDGLKEVTNTETGEKMPLTFYYLPRVRFYYPDPKAIAEATAAQLSAVGITVKLEVPGDWATYLNLRRDGQLYGLYQLGWGGDNGDPDNFLGYFFATPGVSREGYYDNKPLADLLVKARSTPEKEGREKLYQEAEKMLYEDAARIWIAHRNTPLIALKNVEGYIPNPVQSELFKFVIVR